MGDHINLGVSNQVVSSLQHDKIILQKRLTDVQLENQMLRQQLYHVSTLLDIAVGKLGKMGVALETPIDIRSLRSDALKRGMTEAVQSGFDPADPNARENEEQASSASQGRCFQSRTHLREHTKAVQCCAFAPGDDTLIVTGGMDRRLVLQNFFTGEKQWDVLAHDEAVSDVTWLEGARSVLSASYDNTVKVWDPRRPDALPTYQHSASGFVLSVTPLDKAFVFACADSRRCTCIVDTRAHKPISWEHSSRVNSLTFDSSTTQLLMAHSDGVVSIWDIRRAGLALSTSTAQGGGGGSNNNSSNGTGGGGTVGALPPSSTNPAVTALNSANLSLVTLQDSTLSAIARGANISVAASPPMLSGSAPALSSDSSSATGPLGGGGGADPLGGPMTGSGAPLTPVVAEYEGGGSLQGTSAATTVVTTTAAAATSPHIRCVTQFVNEASHSSISYIAHYHSRDDTKRLLCVSGDNMVRVYRSNLNAPSAAHSGELYNLRNVISGVPTVMGFGVRAGFWKGNRKDKSQVSMFFDDGEKDTEQLVTRRLTECDLLVTGGPDNTAMVFDVTEDGNVGTLDRLEGHRDRVTGASLHHSVTRPVIATTSADSTVRIWVPVKT